MFVYRLVLGVAFAGIVVFAYVTREPVPLAERKSAERQPAECEPQEAEQSERKQPSAERAPAPAQPPVKAPVATEKPAAPAPVPATKPFTFIDAMQASQKAEREAHDLYAKGRYSDALLAFTFWRPASGCGTCDDSMRGARYYHIALCRAHRKEHAAAARVCLDAVGRWDWRGQADTFLVQLYREAGQLDDLGPLLDAIEQNAIDKTPKENREWVQQAIRTQSARLILESARRGTFAAWPDDVPKPRTGSLPKTFPNRVP